MSGTRWTLALGSGYRGTVGQLRRATVARLEPDGVHAVETNLVYAAARDAQMAIR